MTWPRLLVLLVFFFHQIFSSVVDFFLANKLFMFRFLLQSVVHSFFSWFLVLLFCVLFLAPEWATARTEQVLIVCLFQDFGWWNGLLQKRTSGSDRHYRTERGTGHVREENGPDRCYDGSYGGFPKIHPAQVESQSEKVAGAVVQRSWPSATAVLSSGPHLCVRDGFQLGFALVLASRCRFRPLFITSYRSLVL